MSGVPGRELWARNYRRLAVAMLVSNFVAAVVVFVFLAFVEPLPRVDDQAASVRVNAIVFVVMAPIALWWGRRMAVKRFTPIFEWLVEDREPTPAERSAVLRGPLIEAQMLAALWGGAAVLFLLVNLAWSTQLAVEIFISVLLGGVVTCALGYLLIERFARPLVERALAGGPPERAEIPGVGARLMLTWAIGTGVFVLGVAVLAVAVLIDPSGSMRRLAATALFLSIAGLAIGLLTMAIASRSVADRLTAVRSSLREVEAGRTDVEVAVDDGSEVGLLQAGVNRMVAGLRERERLRDLFGLHVGEEVARHALEHGVRLGGEVREAAVLFVDLVGSTELAAKRPPEEVVRSLNEFFAIVVEVVRGRGGWINKFEGDAALCVFGAPLPLDDAAGCALAAARELRDRLAAELPGMRAGIGVSAGPVVAGNVGSEERLEYTVIGDPVNEAARLTELAKSRDEGLAASEAVVRLAESAEAARWQVHEPVQLRGRAEATRVAAPA